MNCLVKCFSFFSCAHWNWEFSCGLHSPLNLSHVFNGAIVFKKLWNISFFKETWIFYLDICIAPRKLRQNASYFTHHSKMFFPVQNNLSIKWWVKLGLLHLKKSKLKWILMNCQMIFQLSKVGSTSLYEKNYHKVFISRSFDKL